MEAIALSGGSLPVCHHARLGNATHSVVTAERTQHLSSEPGRRRTQIREDFTISWKCGEESAIDQARLRSYLPLFSPGSRWLWRNG
jgi:hypothetical protein